MTTVLERTVAAARSHLGLNEYPPGSNCQVFSAGLGRPCEAWCADFVCFVDHVDCGLDFAWLNLGQTGSASCRVITVAAQRVGRVGPEPRVGSWVMFGRGGGSHIERVVGLVAGGIDSIGGNTSAPGNYNGGTVAEHRRRFGPGDDIYGYVYPPYTDPEPVQEDDVPYIVKCTDPNHSPAQYAVVSGHVVLIQNTAELQAMLAQGYETKALPAGVFDGVARQAV